jgi:hypothetical protein
VQFLVINWNTLNSNNIPINCWKFTKTFTLNKNNYQVRRRTRNQDLQGQQPLFKRRPNYQLYTLSVSTKNLIQFFLSYKASETFSILSLSLSPSLSLSLSLSNSKSIYLPFLFHFHSHTRANTKRTSFSVLLVLCIFFLKFSFLP